MHDAGCEGNDYFKCDFCRQPWSEERLMIEGHQGSLFCVRCLTPAYTSVVLAKEGEEHRDRKCVMCLEERDQPQWESPLYAEASVCLRCIKQAATVFEKDPEAEWKRPGPPKQEVGDGIYT
ncbi:MAG: hypothetical protein H7Y88_05510 [Phycisphaerales bacterium]|nr:hypothetical protein [Phycisphaerales bacterium]